MNDSKKKSSSNLLLATICMVLILVFSIGCAVCIVSIHRNKMNVTKNDDIQKLEELFMLFSEPFYYAILVANVVFVVGAMVILVYLVGSNNKKESKYDR